MRGKPGLSRTWKVMPRLQQWCHHPLVFEGRLLGQPVSLVPRPKGAPSARKPPVRTSPVPPQPSARVVAGGSGDQSALQISQLMNQVKTLTDQVEAFSPIRSASTSFDLPGKSSMMSRIFSASRFQVPGHEKKGLNLHHKYHSIDLVAGLSASLVSHPFCFKICRQ